MSDARGNYEREICSPYRRQTTDIEHTPPRRIVLLKRADGTDRNSPRDFRSYDGRGASKALLLAMTRAGDSDSCSLERYVDHVDAWIDQLEREQARERERAT